MIFVSTTTLPDHDDAVKTVQRLAEAGITNIEIGADHKLPCDTNKIICMKKELGLQYTVHTFFPPTKDKFFVNISSSDNKILAKSMRTIKNSIEFSRKADAILYSVHGGFTCDLDINCNMINEFKPADKCIETMKSSLLEITDYAKRYGTKIAIENTPPLFRFNLVTRPTLIAEIIKQLKLKNTGILADIGHLNLSSRLEGFDKKEEIEKTKELIMELHFHQNDGTKDQHKPLSDKKMIEFIPKEVIKKSINTLEGNNNWSIEEIKKSTEIINSLL